MTLPPTHAISDGELNAVGRTSLLVAGARAVESREANPLFHDPYAERLAGQAGLMLHERYKRTFGTDFVPVLQVRTRAFDDDLHRLAKEGHRQLVILAAGMDTRAYRMAWPAGMRVYEIDQPAVLEYKARQLAGVATPSCTRVALHADLRQGWMPLLQSAEGFRPGEPTVWLVEGLIHYLDEATVQTLMQRIDALSVRGSASLYDVASRGVLTHPSTRMANAAMAKMGAPWLYTTDQPGEIQGSAWRARVTDSGVLGTQLGRWGQPLAPAGDLSAPRIYFVETHKD